MGAYLLRRLLHSLVVLWGVLTIVFVIVRLLPGNPALLLLGPQAPQEAVEAVNRRLGLDDPLLVQYGDYLAGVVRLDFGDSFVYGGNALTVVADRIPLTTTLALAAMGFALAVSVPLGILAARRPNTVLDRTITSLSLVTQSVPVFWVGIMMILVFSRTLELLPPFGAVGPASLVMPAVALSLPLLGILIRLVRGGLLEVLQEGYVQTARAKGLSERVVVYRHAMRNTLIPLVTVTGLQLGAILGGTVIIETVFSWPGIGRLLIDSIFNRDFAVVQAVVFFICFVFVLLNLLVDVLYGYLDPRVRIEVGAT